MEKGEGRQGEDQKDIDWSANELVLPSDGRLLNLFIDEIKNRLNSIPWSSDSINEVVVCVSEAFNNAVKHGNKNQLEKKVYITINLDNQDLLVSVRDEGVGIPVNDIPDSLAEENLYKTGGRGVFLMKELSSSAEFNGSEVTLRFKNEPSKNEKG